jgi:hypothetical protein
MPVHRPILSVVFVFLLVPTLPAGAVEGAFGFLGPVPHWHSLQAPSTKDQREAQVRKKLALKITLAKGIDRNTPLKDLLDFFGEQFILSFVIDVKAFRKVGIENIEDVPVSLSRQHNVPLGKVLSMVIKQVKGDYQVKKGRVIIVPTGH